MTQTVPALAAPSAALAPPRRGRRGPGGGSRTVGWLFILPNLLGFLAFTLVPLISGIGISFTDWNVISGLGGIKFVGLANFVELVHDPLFWRAVGRTMISTPGSVSR